MKTTKAIWEILLPGQRVEAGVLLALMVVGMVLELLGIGLVVPGLAVMVQDQSRLQSPIFAAVRERMGDIPPSHLLLMGLGIVLAVYAVKCVFLAFLAVRQAAFVARVQTSVSERLFAGYLAQPWQFHLGKNSADLIRNIDSVQGFATTCAVLLMLLAESLVICGLIGLLIWCEPTGAIVVGAMLAVATLVYDRSTRGRLVRWGTLRHRHAAEVFKCIHEGIGGAKDVKVLGREPEFGARFSHHASIMARMSGRQALFQQLPRLWYEFLAVAALCMLTAVMVWQGKPTQAFVPTMGLFAAAAFRVLPSANRIAMGVQQIRFAHVQTETIRSELASIRAQQAAGQAQPIRLACSIELDSISFRYLGATADTLTGISLVIPKGQSIAFIGGSGAGKSTLVDVILGLLEPTTGRVLVDGRDIHISLPGWLANVGYVPQSIFLSDDTIRRNVAFGMNDSEIDEAAVDRALRAAQLDAFVESLPAGKETLVGERGVRLSGGQRQRIGIARALYRDPEVLVLDEATSALDMATEREVMAAVNALHGEKTLLIIAHRLSTVENCDVLYRVEGGCVVVESPLQSSAPRP
jgi:ABC-type multidrug transport system fused ATPase/permease subunit